MHRPFRFGLQAMSLDDASAMGDAARTAAALGYDELYSFDHVGAPDPFVPLMVAALAAPSVAVGPLVLNCGFHQPVLLARTAASVDRMISGRLVLGLGTGYVQSEHDAIGVAMLPPPARVRRFAESLAVLRWLLDTGRASFDGEFHQVSVDDLGVRPVQTHVPFLIGGHGRRVVSLAARHADIFQFTGLTHDAAGVPGPGGFAIAEVRQRATWLTAEAGDRDLTIERSALVQMVHVGGDVESRFEDLADRYSIERHVLEETPFVLIGSVEQLVDKLERLREEIGVSHYVVRDAIGFAPVVAALRGR